MKNTINSFVRDKQGNFAVISAVSMMAIVIGGGITLDLSQTHGTKKAMQNTLDAAVLAAATTDESDFREKVALAFHDNNEGAGKITSFGVNQTDEYRDVYAYASYDRPLNFAKILGKKSTQINVMSVARAHLTPSCVSIKPVVEAEGWDQEILVHGVASQAQAQLQSSSHIKSLKYASLHKLQEKKSFDGLDSIDRNDQSAYSKYAETSFDFETPRILFDQETAEVENFQLAQPIRHIKYEASNQAYTTTTSTQTSTTTTTSSSSASDCLNVKNYKNLYLSMAVKTDYKQLIKQKLAVEAYKSALTLSEKRALKLAYKIPTLKQEKILAPKYAQQKYYSKKIYDLYLDKTKLFTDLEAKSLKEALSSNEETLAFETKSALDSISRLSAYDLESSTQSETDQLPAVGKTIDQKEAYIRSLELIDQQPEYVKAIPVEHLMAYAVKPMEPKAIIKQTALTQEVRPFPTIKYSVQTSSETSTNGTVRPRVQTAVSYDLSQIATCGTASSSSSSTQSQSHIKPLSSNQSVDDEKEALTRSDIQDAASSRPLQDKKSPSGASAPEKKLYRVAMQNEYTPAFEYEIEVECNASKYVYLLK